MRQRVRSALALLVAIAVGVIALDVLADLAGLLVALPFFCLGGSDYSNGRRITAEAKGEQVGAPAHNTSRSDVDARQDGKAHSVERPQPPADLIAKGKTENPKPKSQVDAQQGDSPDAKRVKTDGKREREKAPLNVSEVIRGLKVVGEYKSYGRAVSFSRSGRFVASGSFDGRAKVLDRVTREEKEVKNEDQDAHRFIVSTSAFSPDGKVLATGSWDWTVKLWDVESGTLLYTHKDNENVGCVAFSPNGQYLAAGFGTKLKVWNIGPDKKLTLAQNIAWLGAGVLAFSPDSDTLATTGKRFGNVRQHGERITLWDAKSAKEKKTLLGHTGLVHSLAFSPDGKTLASGGSDYLWGASGSSTFDGGTAKLWDVESGAQKRVLEHSAEVEVCSVAYHPDGVLLATACGDSTVKLWNVESGRAMLKLKAYTGIDLPIQLRLRKLHAVGFSASGKRLVSGTGNGTVTVWEASLPTAAEEGRK